VKQSTRNVVGKQTRAKNLLWLAKRAVSGQNQPQQMLLTQDKEIAMSPWKMLTAADRCCRLAALRRLFHHAA